MKFKGERTSICSASAELFRTLGDQRATVVLTLSNPNGQKIIFIADGGKSTSFPTNWGTLASRDLLIAADA